MMIMKVESYQGKVFDRMIERTPEIFGKKIGHYIPWEKATLLPWIQPAGGGYLNSTKFRGDNMQWDDTLSHKEIQELNNNDTVVLATKMTYSNTRDRYLGYALRKGELRDVMVLVEKAEDNPPSVYNLSLIHI